MPNPDGTLTFSEIAMLEQIRQARTAPPPLRSINPALALAAGLRPASALAGASNAATFTDQALQAALPGGVFGKVSPVEPIASALTSNGEPGVMLGSGEIVPAGVETSTGFGNVLPGVGGALGFADLLQRDRVSPQRGVLQGAASGAALGSVIPGIGTGIGAIGGGVLGLAKSLFGQESRTKIEQERFKRLFQAGLNPNLVPKGTAAADPKAKKGTPNVRPDLPRDFVGLDDEGVWVNNKFASSRNEESLTGKDIWGFATWYERFGSDWTGKLSEQQREQIAQQAVNMKLVREHDGTIDVNFTPEFEQYIARVLGGPAQTVPGAVKNVKDAGQHINLKEKTFDETLASGLR